MNHKNLVKIIGFCVEECDLSTRYILVCEYVDNGNLQQWLHANDVEQINPLSWRTRVDIISGTAKGLAYMHEDFGQKIAHKQLQSHKILLDHQWNPKISDFAVAKLLDHPSLYSYEEMNEEEDVYSFGVLVMEIISGRQPTENNRPKEEQQLVKWLKRMVLNQNYEQVVDPKIPQLPPLKELKRILLIALRCADLVVENRPKMGEVIHMLEPRDLLLSGVQHVYRRSFSQESLISF
ncbi:probable serine/threonine-protein kinase At1g01540 [Beta vulgaris subsp. vulgaris]|uniref:probable serine/threonine-protein kinase At1g01540 n=1 Tax=Beta vulgaris subsp. vulgaris TaxID=3555 RepID=UPI0020367A4E|nr:probable serine/threonine-protein kinase At1g01540 [Beta vulgaris subsp. vulgaris]